MRTRLGLERARRSRCGVCDVQPAGRSCVGSSAWTVEREREREREGMRGHLEGTVKHGRRAGAARARSHRSKRNGGVGGFRSLAPRRLPRPSCSNRSEPSVRDATRIAMDMAKDEFPHTAPRHRRSHLPPTFTTRRTNTFTGSCRQRHRHGDGDTPSRPWRTTSSSPSAQPAAGGVCPSATPGGSSPTVLRGGGGGGIPDARRGEARARDGKEEGEGDGDGR